MGFLEENLAQKVFRALGWRVKRNKILRKDLVKRYWIDNSSDGDEEVLDSDAEFFKK